MDNEFEGRGPADALIALYRERYGACPCIRNLPGAGSGRKYYRLWTDGSRPVVGTWGADTVENRCFVALSDVFRGRGMNVPQVYACSPDFSCYLQEDLGDTSLLDCLSGEERVALAEKSLLSLVGLQTVPVSLWEDKVFSEPFSFRMVMWDLNYFKYDFLKPADIAFDEGRLQDDFENFAETLMRVCARHTGFMYRDFQSRNIMIRNGEPWFIDFQGGRKGPVEYDAVSMLWQSRAGFSAEERKHLLGVYAGELASVIGIPVAAIMEAARPLALLRTFQVLGAYGFRGLIEKKSQFVTSIPGAICNLGEFLGSGMLDAYPELRRVSERLCGSGLASGPESDGLVVKVFSFSYKKGYPQDLSGNGGGFMFDCRGMHNPGRYDELKNLTGLDAPVAGFLEQCGEAPLFVDKAVEMVSPSVATYLRRGFSSLQVGFGCTGGQHRSVYCAERFARLIAGKFPAARIVVEHREQGRTSVYNGA